LSKTTPSCRGPLPVGAIVIVKSVTIDLRAVPQKTAQSRPEDYWGRLRNGLRAQRIQPSLGATLAGGQVSFVGYLGTDLLSEFASNKMKVCGVDTKFMT